MAELEINEAGLVAVQIEGEDYAGTQAGSVGFFDPQRAQWLLDRRRGVIPGVPEPGEEIKLDVVEPKAARPKKGGRK